MSSAAKHDPEMHALTQAGVAHKFTLVSRTSKMLTVRHVASSWQAAFAILVAPICLPLFHGHRRV
jgi:hypothetical protein